MKKSIGILFLCLIFGACSFNKDTEVDITKTDDERTGQDFIVDVSSASISQDDI